MWRRFCALAGFPTIASTDAFTDNSPSWSNGSAIAQPRCLFIVRQGECGSELVVCEDGRSAIYPLTGEQLLLLISQAAKELARSCAH
jgi:hypothetical protein